MKNFKIHKTEIGSNKKTFIIAEIAQAHDGSLGIAHSYIDLAKKCGADAVKFQTHFADLESSKEEKFRINFSYEDKTRFDYWKRMEFTKEDWIGLKTHADKLGLIFISTPFSKKAFELLDNLKVPVWKISSGEVFNPELIKLYKASKKPILISSGMSSDIEIKELITDFKKVNQKLCLMQCTTKYPTPLQDVGLNYLLSIENKFDVISGLSDHSGSLSPSIAAISNKIPVIECHLTFDKTIFGPDATSSLDPKQFKFICDYRDDFYQMVSSDYDKNTISKDLSEIKKLFSRSAFLNKDVSANEKLSIDMIDFKKPGTGITQDQINNFLGKALRKNFNKGEMLKKSFLGK
jgi:N,N'-diacetyllegionaminate synthase